MEGFERARIESYFGRVTSCLGSTDAVTLVVTHLLTERPAFLRAVGRMSRIAAVLPKPKSQVPAVRVQVERDFPCRDLSRELFADGERALRFLEQHASGERVALLDIGGYFAPSLEHVCSAFSGQVLGVVEDTENGHKRYEALGKLPCPVYSVARSPLKHPEDYLVGQSVVFSTEALVRDRGDILQGRRACVIGFGKLGRSVAHMLHAKSVHVTVYDEDPVRMTQALAQGFHVAPSLPVALNGAGLVVCATGNLSLKEEHFSHLRNGAYVASVTSSEDELELDAISDVYERAYVTAHVTRFSTTGHYFYVLADGNAVNFLHGASVGSFIFLVQAEILAALARLADGTHEPGLYEVDERERRRIASAWLDYFNR